MLIVLYEKKILVYTYMPILIVEVWCLFNHTGSVKNVHSAAARPDLLHMIHSK